jgi:2-amino-4-hydroxy-6-hydroxymethyldihydropteridine diphosphokinase
MALRLLAHQVKVEAVSPLYESAPEDGSDQPAYYNAACRVSTDLEPTGLLAHAKAVEHAIGRRRAPRWSPRPIDIDIALYDSQVLESEDLTIPHPHLTQRPFVLVPLLDIDPGLALPDGRRLSELPAANRDTLTLVAGSEWWTAPNLGAASTP